MDKVDKVNKVRNAQLARVKLAQITLLVVVASAAEIYCRLAHAPNHGGFLGRARVVRTLPPPPRHSLFPRRRSSRQVSK